MRVLALLVLMSLGLVAAGCGGGGKSPSVASLGGATTTTSDSSTDSAPSAGGSAAGPSGSNFSLVMKTQNGEKFAQCMRKNGVPNFPDPNGQGQITINGSSGIDPRSPKFQKAEQTCRKLLPNGGEATPQQRAQMQQQMLKFAACMRAHGVKDFPDPDFSNGHGSIQLKGGPGSDLNPDSPTFQRAQNACKADLPGKLGGPGGPTTSSGSK
jgi:hypothetical protein